MEDTVRTGGCTCGAIRYSLKGDPYRFGICHCTKCRKESGSVFTAYAHWKIEDSEVTGKYRTYEGRSFCPTCGSRLFDAHENDIEIRIGSLDEVPTTLLSPEHEGWIKRRELWLLPVGGASQNVEDPPKSE
jgi:hypothetical protein